MSGLPLVSLFSGPGGLDLGFEQSGFEPLLALDRDSAAVETYNANRPRPPRARVADLSRVRPKTIINWWEELAPGVRPLGIIGGPPCEAFSRVNSHKIEADPRAKLPLAYARILRSFNERYGVEFFLFENVVGLRWARHRSSLESFKVAFAKAGFFVNELVLDAADYGVAQHRKRMFIVGFNRDLFGELGFDPPAVTMSPVTVRQAIGSLDEPMFFSRKQTPADMGLHPNHWCMNPRSPKFKNGALKPGETPGRSLRQLNWDSPSWTVAYGHREVHVHPNGTRRLSVP